MNAVPKKSKFVAFAALCLSAAALCGCHKTRTDDSPGPGLPAAVQPSRAQDAQAEPGYTEIRTGSAVIRISGSGMASVTVSQGDGGQTILVNQSASDEDYGYSDDDDDDDEGCEDNGQGPAEPQPAPKSKPKTAQATHPAQKIAKAPAKETSPSAEASAQGVKILRIRGHEQFKKEVLQSKVPVLAIFETSWCPVCKAEAAVAVEFAKSSHANVAIARIDVEENESWVKAYRKKPGIPENAGFWQGKALQGPFYAYGGLPKASFEAFAMRLDKLGDNAPAPSGPSASQEPANAGGAPASAPPKP